MSCAVGHRLSLDPALLWLWHRPAAVAPTRPLAWEPPYAAGVAPEKAKRQKKKKKTQRLATNEWINEVQYIHTWNTTCWKNKNKNKLLIHTLTNLDLKYIHLSERSQTQKAAYCMITFI